MKIIHVYKDAFPPVIGGIERYIHDVAGSAAAQGHTVEVWAAGVRQSRDDLMPNGTLIRRCKEYGRLLSTPFAPSLTAATLRAEGDLIHLHVPNPTAELGLLLGARAPALVSFHAQLGRQQALLPLYRPLQRAVFRRAKLIIVGSKPMSRVRDLAGFGSKIEILPYGVSPGLISRAQRDDAWDGLRILFVGRLVYYKGLGVLLASVRRLPKVSLTIIGEGPLRASITDLLAGDGDLQRRVHMLGTVSDPDLVEAYRRHDVLVLPSISAAESFGLAMAEAMANGLPVISTALKTGTDWVNDHSVTGYVVRPADPAGLAGALQRMADDPAGRLAMGEAARRRAAAHFSFDRHVERLLSLYEEVVSNG